MIELRKLIEENFSECLDLKVAANQQTFVAPNVLSLAEAWLYYDSAYPFAIYSDGIMVGFVLITFDKDVNKYWICRFMIDEKHQNKGYGKLALKEVIDYIVNTFKATELFLSFEPENLCAKRLYESSGFEDTGEINEGELVMRLVVSA
ncbi:MAG: GNAT family N-acetyltransferase [Oscillospiraceae bacterium]